MNADLFNMKEKFKQQQQEIRKSISKSNGFN